MKINVRKSRVSLFQCGALVSALLVGSLPVYAQTFFGGGGNANNASGATNVGLGYHVLFANSTGQSNAGLGYSALSSNTTGSGNVAVGWATLAGNTTGTYNVALGYHSLKGNTIGSNNIASGCQALYYNTSGSGNIASGYNALQNNTLGNYNLALGIFALSSNKTGDYNIASGYGALYSNVEGSYNLAHGLNALYFNTTGYYNTASGYNALKNNTTGNGNTALGYSAGQNITTGNNNLTLSNTGQASDNGVTRIGTTGKQVATFVAGINGVNISAGVAVYIDKSGQLGTITSSRRFKNEIKTMGNVSDKLLKLRPVTFRYKSADSKGGHPLQYGLIAEEVAKVFPDLVQYDKQGKPFTIYYHLLTPMLLSELQKANSKIQAMNRKVEAVHTGYKAEVTALRVDLAQQKRLLTQLAAYVQNSKPNAPLQKVNMVQH